MDEMLLISELGQEIPLPSREQLAPARDQLAIAMATQSARSAIDVPTVRSVRRRRSGWRVVWAGIAVAGVAAAVTGVVVLAPDQIGGKVPAANAEAAQVLHQAAAAALRVPDVEPRADQFVYAKTRSGGEERESWRSVNGTRDGLAVIRTDRLTEQAPFPGCRNGRQTVVKGTRLVPGQTEPCTPEPAYLPDLPTDAAGMLAYLRAHVSGESGDVNAMGKNIAELNQGSYLRPAARAALFEAAARMPGLTMVRNATDGAGRPGTGIGWSFDGKSGLLVFDAGNHAFLGMSESAILSVGVVDKVGDRG